MAWIHFEVFAYAVWVVLIIASVYLTFHARSYNSEAFMKKRNLNLFYAHNMAIIIVMISYLFFGICCIHFADPWTWTISVSCVLWSKAVFAWVSILAIKNWSIFYQYRWSLYVSQANWQPTYTANADKPDLHATLVHKNWFIANHETFGNIRWISKRLGLAAIVCSILSSLIWTVPFHINPDMSFFLCMLVVMNIYAPWLMLYVFCVWKTPAFDDPYKIHWESKMHARLLCLTFPPAPFCLVWIIMTGDMRVFFVNLFILCLILFSMLFVSTYLVPKRVREHKETEKKTKTEATESMSLHMKLMSSMTLRVKVKEQQSNEVLYELDGDSDELQSIETVLKHQQAVDAKKEAETEGIEVITEN